ncbi:hypothetical protein NON00_13030 [Roseomonas sp. GC11]|uniref:hypothetical protein n=1 Tax=Roseomonas sp. GC11 TaxID=2950546 RepID=UPI0021096D43|nr:hypothetical protein [Roseomonas sp. GC11]MCQ4160851.1 hypothetical protein [Roseomonas sp. GC11]
MAAAYALAGPAADRLIDWDETEGQAAVAFSLRGRGDAGKREIEAEVMGDGQTVPALGTGGGGAGHRFVAEVRSRWVRVRGLK